MELPSPIIQTDCRAFQWLKYAVVLLDGQERLVEVSGFHNRYIGAVERGEKNITLLNLEKMAEALDVEVQELFRYSDIDLGETNKQRDLQEIVELLLRRTGEDIKKAKVILREIYTQ